MRILFTGFFDLEYARNRILRSGLEEHGIELVFRPLGKATLASLRSLVSVVREEVYDAVLVGHSDDQYAVPVVCLFSSKPVIWDAFYSLYDTRVNDRDLVSRWNPKAWWYWILDWASIKMADAVLVDTKEHAQFFKRSFGLTSEKTIVVYVGADTSVFYPRPEIRTQDRLVGFYGKFIPLQGVPVIIRAAKLLEEENIHFEIIGSGQEYGSARTLADTLQTRNITFHKRVPYEELPKYVARWSVSLGIFGSSKKAARVIPNKVYEAAAAGKAIVTRDSPAVREVFSERTLFLSGTSPEELANAIRTLLENSTLRHQLETESLRLFEEKLTPRAVVAPLIEHLRGKYTAS